MPQGGSGSESKDGESSGNVDNVGQTSGKKGMKLSAMGAGLGDLLTQGAPSAVSGSGSGSSSSNIRG